MIAAEEAYQRSTTALVEDFLEQVWNRGLIDSCDEFVANTYDIAHDPGDPWDGRLLSRDEFKERVRLSRAPIPDQRFEIVHLAEAAGKVFVAWTWQGTHLGEVAGVAPTGRILTMSGATVYFVTDGKVSGHWQAVDRLGVLKQLTAR